MDLFELAEQRRPIGRKVLVEVTDRTGTLHAAVPVLEMQGYTVAIFDRHLIATRHLAHDIDDVGLGLRAIRREVECIVRNYGGDHVWCSFV